MTPITHRNRKIERLERELAESREECRRLREALQPFANQMPFFLECAVHWGQIGEHKSLRAFSSTSLLTSHIANPIDALRFEHFKCAFKALAPKVGDK